MKKRIATKIMNSVKKKYYKHIFSYSRINPEQDRLRFNFEKDTPYIELTLLDGEMKEKEKIRIYEYDKDISKKQEDSYAFLYKNRVIIVKDESKIEQECNKIESRLKDRADKIKAKIESASLFFVIFLILSAAVTIIYLFSQTPIFKFFVEVIEGMSNLFFHLFFN